MGVPGLFAWLRETFPDLVTTFRIDDSFRKDVDNLYIDGNAILHKFAQRVFNYGQHASMMGSDNDDLTYHEKCTKTFELFFRDIIDISNIVRPRKLIYIAIDGPAPLAKQAQQRQRRFIAALERDYKKFDSNSITPGTEFMLHLTRYMNYAIRKELSTSKRNIDIIFSGPTVPGEGEHKAMEHIRSNPNKMVESSCVFGPDGDLIMLTAASECPNIFILREDHEEIDTYHYLDMGGFRKRLPDVLNKKDGINDFILLGFFVGNDFLPKIQMFVFLRDGIEKMINIIRTQKSSIHGQSGINFYSFTNFVSEMASTEVYSIRDQAKITPRDPALKNETLLQHYDVSRNFLDIKAYRTSYYLKARLDARNTEAIDSLCKDYIKSLFWIFKYYTTGLPSWTHFYKNLYPPLMSDLAQSLKRMTVTEFDSLSTFTMGSPSVPFVQLLCVLPPLSATLLPNPLRWLLLDWESPLVKKGYYPLGIEIDYEGKYHKHMGIAILSFPDITEVKRYYEKIAATFKNVYERNIIGVNYIFRRDKRYLFTYTSEFGKFEHSVVKEEYP